MNRFLYILIALLIWNAVVFALYGIDKLKAKKGARRISEKALLLCAFFFGGVGALLGMQVFRHKTKHKKFKILVPLFAALNIALLLLYYFRF